MKAWENQTLNKIQDSKADVLSLFSYILVINIEPKQMLLTVKAYLRQSILKKKAKRTKRVEIPNCTFICAFLISSFHAFVFSNSIPSRLCSIFNLRYKTFRLKSKGKTDQTNWKTKYRFYIFFFFIHLLIYY